MEYKRFILMSFLLAMIIPANNTVSGQLSGREVQNFNFGWKFFKGDLNNGQDPALNDASWRTIDIPHDWSIEEEFNKGYASSTAFLPAGIGWYRKSFLIPETEKNRMVFISFDGVYNNSEVWINGIYLGKRPYGYISFQYDLTPYIKFGKENNISVKVDHSKYGDSRWYTGSGIYRNVKLIFASMVHIGQWGIYAVQKNVSSTKATLDIETSVVNGSDKTVQAQLINYLMNAGDTVKKISRSVMLAPRYSGVVSQILEINKPNLWDIDNPNLYSLVTVLNSENSSDSQITRIGFRNLKFDPDKGFFLNGKNLKLKGICMHHDAGTLGSAVPVQVFARRLDLLKEAGCNAIRTSHYPFSPEFLDLCDEKGFLVIGEAFDEWELPKKKWIEGWNVGTPGKDGYSSYFKDWHSADLKDMILRDRNHPSIIMWSIGNEIDYPDDPYTHPILNTEANPQSWAKYDTKLPDARRLGEIATELVGIVKKNDTTRPVTAGLASVLMSNVSGYADALDVTGYNYQEFRYASDHKKYPKRIIYGSENGMTLDNWEAVTQNDFVLGQFLWTGIDYLGEAAKFPSRHSTSGIIDLAGNKKPEFYFRQSLWTDKPMVYIGTTDRVEGNNSADLWAHKMVDPVWNYAQGQKIVINVFTNCDETELFLNNKSLGIKKPADTKTRILVWEVPFEEGKLKAVGRKAGNEAATFELNTTGAAAKLVAKCDVKSLKADRTDLATINVDLCDEAGNTVYSAENEIKCEINGPVRLLGMEDSNPKNIEYYKDNVQHAFHGKLLIYLQSLEESGKALVKLSSPGLKETIVEIDVVR